MSWIRFLKPNRRSAIIVALRLRGLMRTQLVPLMCLLPLLIAAVHLDGNLRSAKAAGFVTNPTVLVPESPLSLPGYLQPFVEPDFNTKITRVTLTQTTQFQVNWADTVRHHYSLDQAWSAGMSHLLIYNYASPSYLLLNGQNYTYDKSLNISPDEIRWDPLDDNVSVTSPL